MDHPIACCSGDHGKIRSCLPIHFVEFGENGIWFDDQRFCKPFITDTVLNEIFGADFVGAARSQFLIPNKFSGYDLLT